MPPHIYLWVKGGLGSSGSKDSHLLHKFLCVHQKSHYLQCCHRKLTWRHLLSITSLSTGRSASTIHINLHLRHGSFLWALRRWRRCQLIMVTFFAFKISFSSPISIKYILKIYTQGILFVCVTMGLGYFLFCQCLVTFFWTVGFSCYFAWSGIK